MNVSTNAMIQLAVYVGGLMLVWTAALFAARQWSRPKVQAAWRWYYATSALLGMPVLLVLMLVGMQKVVFTTTCSLAGLSCQYAISGSAPVNLVNELIAQSEDGFDTVLVPNGKGGAKAKKEKREL